ncbi:MAG TPA: TetR/AcrR family transcriptional regulator [Solirubrobacterales bacterium]|nr:TetR/AcrR family transcriptional regulator [Solirubrobacterales bacterium]
MQSPSPLPRGRHRLPFQVVVENQRRRLIAGVARAVAEQGYAELTVKHVIEAAGVSRTTFYANFDNKRDCVLAAHQDVFERLLALLLRACATERDWPQKARASIAALFAFAAEAPDEVRLLTLDALATDLTIARQVVDSNAHFAALLRDGRRHTPLGDALPDLTEEALIGAISSILAGRLLEGGVEGLAGLGPELVQLVLTPYVGTEEAARVAAAGA